MKKGTNGRSNVTAWRSALDDFWPTDKWFPEDFFRSRFRAFPAVNILDEENRYVIELAAPGLTKEDFKIEMDNGLLRIAADKTSTDETKEDNYTRREFNYCTFKRAFNLPENVDMSGVEAKYKDGVLHIVLHKMAVEMPATAKKISIS